MCACAGVRVAVCACVHVRRHTVHVCGVYVYTSLFAYVFEWKDVIEPESFYCMKTIIIYYHMV